MTQYFTDLLLREQGLAEVTDHEYEDQLACAQQARRARPSWQVVAAAYFLSDGALREALMKSLQARPGRAQPRPAIGARGSARSAVGHDVGVLLADLAAVSETVAATSARGAKVEALAGALRLASPEEAAIAVAYLSGELRQRQIGVGWAALRELPEPAASSRR